MTDMALLADPTTPTGLLQWAFAFGVIVIVIAVAGFLVRLFVKWAPTARKVAHFVDDVAGEPERPGVPARPGLMERMSELETGMAAIQKQVTPNHGSSMNDWVRDIGSRLDDHIEESKPIKRQVSELHDHYISKEKP